MTPAMVEWLKRFVDSIGGLPTNYMLLDSETSGFGSAARVWEFGYMHIVDRLIGSQGAVHINITKEDTPEGALRKQFEETRERMLEQGADWGEVTWDWLAANGGDPQQVYNELYQMLKAGTAAGTHIIGHHLIKFDMRFWRQGFTHWCGAPEAPWKDDLIIETRNIFGAMQKGLAVPTAGLADWNEKVAGAVNAKGTQTKQDFCMALCGIADPPVHRALIDCQQVYRMIEYIREITR